jgi:hypothetical protein
MRSYLFTRGYEGDSVDTLCTFEPQAVVKEVWDTLMIYIADTVTWDTGRTGEIIWNVSECLQKSTRHEHQLHILPICETHLSIDAVVIAVVRQEKISTQQVQLIQQIQRQ